MDLADIPGRHRAFIYIYWSPGIIAATSKSSCFVQLTEKSELVTPEQTLSFAHNQGMFVPK
jgi:hypothetical protein